MKNLRELKNIHEQENKDYYNTKEGSLCLNSLRFTFSVLISGCSFATSQIIFLWNSIMPPSESYFYKAQKIIACIIIEMARESCARWRRVMRCGSCLAFDGSWSHRRNADHCLVDFVDIRTGKIVAFEIVSKKDKGNNHFEGPSNVKEVEGLKPLIPRWKEDDRVKTYVHNNDAKTRKLIKEMQWNVEEMIDSYIAINSFRRKFNRMKSEATSKLRGLRIPLERFFQALLRIDLTIEAKEALWLNFSEHLDRNHKKCLPRKKCERWAKINEGNNREVLDRFLDKTKELLTKCDRIHSTQMCESLHSVKSQTKARLGNLVGLHAFVQQFLTLMKKTGQ